jgi:hypothetical protein
MELDSVAAALDIAGLDMVAPPPAFDALTSEDSIGASLAQPPTKSPKTVINSAFLSMSVPSRKIVFTHHTFGEGRNRRSLQRVRV